MTQDMARLCNMTMEHYDAVLALMKKTPGICVRDADSREATARYLERNPGLSFVAMDEGHVVGCAMCGHDGRRGYLQHVIVEPEYRGKGIAKKMVANCLIELEALGIFKVHLEVLLDNTAALDYWTNQGWQRREDTRRFSYAKAGHTNA